MKATLRNAMEIERKGGAVMSSQWTLGSGNYITSRPVPVFCEKIDLNGWERPDEKLTGKTKRTVARIRKKHPRCQYIIAVTDRRGLLRAWRDTPEYKAEKAAVKEQNRHAVELAELIN